MWNSFKTTKIVLDGENCFLVILYIKRQTIYSYAVIVIMLTLQYAKCNVILLLYDVLNAFTKNKYLLDAIKDVNVLYYTINIIICYYNTLPPHKIHAWHAVLYTHHPQSF